MRFSLIVPCFNHLEVSQQFLRSLLAHGPLGADVELVLVDDASTDGTAQWMDSLQSPFVTVVRHAQNQGFAKAMNSGAQQARGEFLMLLNNDLVLTPHWFDPFESHAKRWQSDWGILGNVQIRTADNTVDHAGFEFTEQGQLRHRQSVPPNVDDQACPLLTGACIMLPRQDFFSYGGFDSAYLNGGEDLELCLQALQQGRTNKVLLNSQVFHQVSVSRASVEREHRDIANLVRLYGRWLEVLARLYALQYPTHNALHVMEAELLRLRTHVAAKKPLFDLNLSNI